MFHLKMCDSWITEMMLEVVVGTMLGIVILIEVIDIVIMATGIFRVLSRVLAISLKEIKLKPIIKAVESISLAKYHTLMSDLIAMISLMMMVIRSVMFLLTLSKPSVEVALMTTRKMTLPVPEVVQDFLCSHVVIMLRRKIKTVIL